jgi:uncharacterized protein with ACT and thioredoxin-like domain
MTKAISLTTEEDTIRVRRVKISERANRVLEEIAKQYGCTYNKKLSISGLLSQIAEGRLKVIRSELTVAPSVPLIELDIEVHSNLNGTLAEIAKKIADSKANIYRVKAVETSKNSKIKILLFVPESCSLAKLVKSLYGITVGDVLDFNEEENLDNLLEVIDFDYSRIYKRAKKKGTNVKIRELFEETIEYKTEKLITNITCTIGFQFIIDNEPGTLDALTHKIAEKRISINSISIDFNANENTNLVNMCLGFCPSTDEVSQKFDSIKKYIKSLKTLDFVKSVRQRSVDYLNYKDK